jgi:nicotinamide mononucleotide adenylyltransferase
MRIATKRSALSPTSSPLRRPLHCYPRLRSDFPRLIPSRYQSETACSTLTSLPYPRTFTTSPQSRRSRPFTAADVNMDAYTFPTDKMRKLKDSSRTPLILISCGSFSPITYLHLRMFEMCVDWVRENTRYEVVGGYLSPVSDAYKKQGLALAHHRLEMCRLASSESNWIMVDSWEASKAEYTRTALVLDHFQHEINEVIGGVETSNGERKPAKIALLSGADLIQTMSEPGVWSPDDLDHILGRYGGFIIERSGTDMEKALANLSKFRANIFPIPQLVREIQKLP